MHNLCIFKTQCHEKKPGCITFRTALVYNLSYFGEESSGCLELSMKSKYRFCVSNLVRPPLSAFSDGLTKMRTLCKKDEGATI